MKAIVNGLEYELTVVEFVELQKLIGGKSTKITATEPEKKTVVFGFDEPLEHKNIVAGNAPVKKPGVGLRQAVRLRFADNNVRLFKTQTELRIAFPQISFSKLSVMHNGADDYVIRQGDVVRKLLAPKYTLTEYTRWTTRGREIKASFPANVNVEG